MMSDNLSPRGTAREASVAELLEDPIMHLLLRRDGLRAEEVAAFLATARRRYRGSRNRDALPPSMLAIGDGAGEESGTTAGRAF